MVKYSGLLWILQLKKPKFKPWLCPTLAVLLLALKIYLFIGD